MDITASPSDFRKWCEAAYLNYHSAALRGDAAAALRAKDLGSGLSATLFASCPPNIIDTLEWLRQLPAALRAEFPAFYSDECEWEHEIFDDVEFFLTRHDEYSYANFSGNLAECFQAEDDALKLIAMPQEYMGDEPEARTNEGFWLGPHSGLLQDHGKTFN